MRELPTGTLTLLFSDIEGSTSTLNRLGTAWGESLSAHRRILRAAFAAHGGVEMGTEGDSFFVVFRSAAEGVLAAVEGQRHLTGFDWPGGEPLRVRMGLHTGQPQRHEDGYIGIDVHRAARIAAAAGGGQIVLSSATQSLLADAASDFSLRDLGWHRLKDFPDPEHLYDVMGEGMPADHPPLRSLGTRANLPVHSTELIAREVEVAQLVRMIRVQDARLVTLTGTGGTGKTRLAVAVAAELEHWVPGGTYFVALDSANTSSSMWSAIAAAVGASPDRKQSPQKRVIDFLAGRSPLLVLDNLEQIPDAHAAVSRLLGATPGLRVLATSRKPLHLVDEQLFPVSPLQVPADVPAQSPGDAQTGAVDLFVRRARMVNPRFALSPDNVGDVVRLCRQLDGLPLAIELAAARTRFLSPTALLKRLDDKLGEHERAGDRVQRQRTLASTIAWSYELLEPKEQRVFRSLGVFASQFDLEAVGSVLAAEDDGPLAAVEDLVDVSLVELGEGPDGEPVLRMLETIRRDARQRLRESGEHDQLRMRHARWCLGVATEMSALIGGPRQVMAQNRLDSCVPDIRSALDWSLQAGGPDDRRERQECGYALLAPMITYWYRFGHVAEGRAWCERALGILDSGAVVDSAAIIDALHGQGILALQQSDLTTSTRALERASGMAQRLGDLTRQARESNSLGIARRDAGDARKARALIESSLEVARRINDRPREATALSNLVTLCIDSGDYDQAVEFAQAALDVDTELDNRWGVAINQTNLVLALLHTEGPERAYEHLVTVAADAFELGDVELNIELLELFACVWAELGQAHRAARLLGTADCQRENAGIRRGGADQILMDRHLEEARNSLATQAWASEYAEGRSSTMDEALAYAHSRRPAQAAPARDGASRREAQHKPGT